MGFHFLNVADYEQTADIYANSCFYEETAADKGKIK